jgi:hypothetical protein
MNQILKRIYDTGKKTLNFTFNEGKQDTPKLLGASSYRAATVQRATREVY